MKKNLFLLPALILFSFTVSGQTTFQEAIKSNNASLYNGKIKMTTDRGFIITSNYAAGTGQNKLMLAKFDNKAQLQWQRVFEDSLYDYNPSNIVLCNDGGYAVAGISYGGPGYSIFVAKFSSAGDPLWKRRFTYSAKGFYSIFTRDITITKNNTLLITGSSNLSTYGDVFVLSMNATDGNVNWFRTVGADGPNETGFSISTTHDAGFIVGGFSGSPGALSDNFLVIKFNNKGRPQWAKTFRNINNYGNDDITGITATLDGGYAFTGYTLSTLYSYDRVIVKLDSSGIVQWGKQLKKLTYDMSGNIIQNKYGSYIIGGSNTNATLSRFSAAGSILSSTDFAENQSFSSLALAKNGSFLAVSTASSRLVISGFDSLAQNCGLVNFTDTAQDFLLTSATPKYSAGDLTDSLINLDIVLREVTPGTMFINKLCKKTESIASSNNVSTINAADAKKFALNVYPNPAVGSKLTVSFTGVASGNIALYITDASGRLQSAYHYPAVPGTIFTKEINVAQLKAGMYMLTAVDANNKSIVSFVKIN